MDTTDPGPSATAPPVSPRATSTPKPLRQRLLLAAFGLLAGGAVAYALWSGWFRGAASQPPDGMLIVHVRPAGMGEALQIEEPGAVPVRDGGCMNLEVQHREPACTYLVWLNCQGQAVPLYPWNTDKIEVTDLNQPPPMRRAAKVLNSPLVFGGAWSFADGSGMETLLLLARSTPLPEGTSVGKLLGDLPPRVAVGKEKELVILEVRDHAPQVTTVLSRDRGDEAAAKAADDALGALLLRLSPHFDLVRAVRFAHVGKDEQPSAP